jgi:hypothetical protein
MPAVAEAVAVVWRPPGVEMGDIAPRGREVQGLTLGQFGGGGGGVPIMPLERVATAVPEL